MQHARVIVALLILSLPIFLARPASCAAISSASPDSPRAVWVPCIRRKLAANRASQCHSPRTSTKSARHSRRKTGSACRRGTQASLHRSAGMSCKEASVSLALVPTSPMLDHSLRKPYCTECLSEVKPVPQSDSRPLLMTRPLSPQIPHVAGFRIEQRRRRHPILRRFVQKSP